MRPVGIQSATRLGKAARPNPGTTLAKLLATAPKFVPALRSECEDPTQSCFAWLFSPLSASLTCPFELDDSLFVFAKTTTN